MIYYFLFARHWYTGPKMTVDESCSTNSDTAICESFPQTSVDAKEE